MFCDIVIPRTRLDELTYRFDPSVIGELGPGDCVRVRLKGKRRAGIVIAIREKSPVENTLAIEAVVERQLVPVELVRLVRWIASYYYATLGDVLGQVLPRGILTHLLREKATETALVCESARADAGLPAGLVKAISERRFGVWVSCRDRDRLKLVTDFARGALGFGSVLLLIPEGQLPQWLPGLQECFGMRLVEYRTGISASVRKRNWRAIREGVGRVVVGVRSVVLAPVPDLAGIVVVDEHEPGFKEQRRPRFHARDVAVMRARLAGCPVVICDRTPSTETWQNLVMNRWHWLERPTPVAHWRNVSVVDMRRHRGEVLAPLLVRELQKAQEKGKSAVLYINRRGFSRHVECRDCGGVLKCARCAVPGILTAERTLVCRYCGTGWSAPDTCPECRGTEFEFLSVGVEMVENEVKRRFAGIMTRRVIADTRSEPLERGTVLVGTKALFTRQWPEDVATVAVINADADLVLSDFRARERTFQVLYELCRRAARVGARVIVQTRRPDETAIRDAVEGQVAAFLDDELRARAEVGFPPFCRLVALEFSGNQEKAVSHAERIGRLLEGNPGVEVLGPVLLMGKRPRWRMLVKLPRNRTLSSLLERKGLEKPGVDVRVDVDPLEVI
ncbi:MAG: primosomal protein N' [candidate division WOR-3 bacterium]